MWQKILTVLGLLPAVAAGLASKKDSDRENGLETDGQASIAFVAGSKTVVPPDAAETQDERLARITDRALVWPGKPETIYCANQETMAFRYDLTVTDLPDTLYLRRPAVGGSWDPAGGVLLQPGEEASFEVVFVPPPAADKTRTRPFSYVLTRFDPRRSSDPGEIEADQPMRWVALPEPGDLKIAAEALHVVTRPWRRSALLQINLRNKALLPSSVSLLITRAATKDALVKEPEDVDKIAQSIPDLTPGTWRCLLPPFAERSSYYATVTGTARVADREDYALSLPKPVYVQYVPWLRVARDWFLLAGGLVLLLWIVWGFPVYETPKLLVHLQFAGLEEDEFPAGSAIGDLTMSAQLFDSHRSPVGEPSRGFSRPGGVTEIDLPGRWCGFRWFGKNGWNGFCSQSQDYSFTILALPGKETEFNRYALSKAYLGAATSIQVTDLANPFGTWTIPQTLNIPKQKGVVVRVFVQDLGWLATRKGQQYVSIAYTLDGVQPTPPAELPLPSNPKTPIETIDLTGTGKVTDANPHLVVVSASCLGSDTNKVNKTVVPQEEPFNFGVSFSSVQPIDKGAVVAQAGKDAAAAGTAAASATAAVGAAAAAGGANPSPAVKAQIDAVDKAARDASQAAQAANSASAAAQVAAASPTASAEDVQAQATNAAKAQGDATKASEAAQDALNRIQKMVVVPVHQHNVVTNVPTITPEDYLLLDQWDNARHAASQSNLGPAYQHAINAISYAMPFYVNPANPPGGDLNEARAALANAQEDPSSPTTQALTEIAQGWIDRAPHTKQAEVKARTDFDAVPDQQRNLLLVKIAVAEGEQKPSDRVNTLLGYLNDPRLHLTKEDKSGIQHQIDDINVHILHR